MRVRRLVCFILPATSRALGELQLHLLLIRLHLFGQLIAEVIFFVHLIASEVGTHHLRTSPDQWVLDLPSEGVLVVKVAIAVDEDLQDVGVVRLSLLLSSGCPHPPSS